VQVLPAVLKACLCMGAGCDYKSSPSTQPRGLPSPAPAPEPVDPKAFTAGEFDRIRGGFAEFNAGRMLIQRTHPTGTYIASDPPAMVLSADRREIIGNVTVRWSGGVTGAEYQTDFTIEITKGRVRLTVERDLAVFQI
jgi:hypothetical protein